MEIRNIYRSLTKKSIKERYKHFKSLITVEPILICYIMPSVLSGLATQNLFLEKACRVNLKYDDVVCDALTIRETANYTLEEDEVQKITASVASWKAIIQSTIPSILIIFLGSWSDRVGRRKVCFLMPIIGEMLSSIGLLVNTYFFHELPMEVAAFTEVIFPALAGGWFTMTLGVFSFISDITTEETRTVRIGFVNMVSSLGIPIGSALSGILYRAIGFYGVFSITTVLYIIGFFYGCFKVHEPRKPVVNQIHNRGYWGDIRDFFDLTHVRDTALVAFKDGPGRRRLRLIMLLIVTCVVVGPMHGEMAMTYLFMRLRFNWDEIQFSIFCTYNMMVGLVGTLFSVGVFSHHMRLDDAVVGIISSVSKILSGFVYAFAITDWQIYMGPLLEIFNGTSFIAMRSMVSKIVASNELGKVNSLFCIAEGMMPLVYAPMYAALYRATLASFPGAFFLLGAALTLPAVLMFAWIYKVNKEEDSKTVGSTGNKTGFTNPTFESEDIVRTNDGRQADNNVIPNSENINRNNLNIKTPSRFKFFNKSLI